MSPGTYVIMESQSHRWHFTVEMCIHHTRTFTVGRDLSLFREQTSIYSLLQCLAVTRKIDIDDPQMGTQHTVNTVTRKMKKCQVSPLPAVLKAHVGTQTKWD